MHKKGYASSLKTDEIDDNDSTSSPRLRIADQENETEDGDSYMGYDEDDGGGIENDENDDGDMIVGGCDHETKSLNNEKSSSPNVNNDNDNRVYPCNEKNINVNGKNLTKESHSLCWELRFTV